MPRAPMRPQFAEPQPGHYTAPGCCLAAPLPAQENVHPGRASQGVQSHRYPHTPGKRQHHAQPPRRIPQAAQRIGIKRVSAVIRRRPERPRVPQGDCPLPKKYLRQMGCGHIRKMCARHVGHGIPIRPQQHQQPHRPCSPHPYRRPRGITPPRQHALQQCQGAIPQIPTSCG